MRQKVLTPEALTFLNVVVTFVIMCRNINDYVRQPTGTRYQVALPLCVMRTYRYQVVITAPELTPLFNDIDSSTINSTVASISGVRKYLVDSY